MQVVLHAGAHITDEGKLPRCLGLNAELLAQYGTAAPDPRSYQKQVRDVLNNALAAEERDAARAALLQIADTQAPPDRLVLSSEGFFGTPKMATGQGGFYTAAEQRLRNLQGVFGHDEVELFMAICNPATFLPALLKRAKLPSMADLIGASEPSDLRWSQMITRIRQACPEVTLTIWCNEDTPLIWAEVMREMAGLDPTARMKGEHTLLAEIMTREGMARFESYLSSHPGMSEIQKRRVIAAFLDKFAKEDEIEAELDVPGWTEALVDQLTEIYDEDVFEIQRIPGVHLITP